MSFSPLYTNKLINNVHTWSSTIRRPVSTTNNFENTLASLKQQEEEASRASGKAVVTEAQVDVTVGPQDQLESRRLATLASMSTARKGPVAPKHADAKGQDAAEPSGRLSSPFESGQEGARAIGYDHLGGTCYGSYQFSSRQGTMSRFLKFLDTAAPDLATRLRAAGHTDTGGRNGRMPNVWRAISNEQGERFEELQRRFIADSHYQPVVDALAETPGLDPRNMPKALREVVFSTAVQHGPQRAQRIISRAAASLKGRAEADPATLIDRIYAVRSRQFEGSPESVQQAVRRRLLDERSRALSMLRQEQTATRA